MLDWAAASPTAISSAQRPAGWCTACSRTFPARPPEGNMAPMTTLHWASRFSRTCMLAAKGASSSAVSVLSRACRGRALELTLLLSFWRLPSIGH